MRPALLPLFSGSQSDNALAGARRLTAYGQVLDDVELDAQIAQADPLALAYLLGRLEGTGRGARIEARLRQQQLL